MLNSVVDGGWSSWSSYGDCSKTCGGGFKTRSRLSKCPIQDHRHHIVLKWFKCDFKSGLAQTQHPPAVGIPVLETLLKLRIATLMVCLFISPTFFTSAENLISIITLKWSTAVGVLGPTTEHAAKAA